MPEIYLPLDQSKDQVLMIPPASFDSSLNNCCHITIVYVRWQVLAKIYVHRATEHD